MDEFFYGIVWGVLLGIPSGLSIAHLLLRVREQKVSAVLLTGLGTSLGITCYGALSLVLFSWLKGFSQEVLLVTGAIVLFMAFLRIFWPQRDWPEVEVFPQKYRFFSALVVAISCPGSLASLLLGRAAGIAAGNPLELLLGALVGAILWNGFLAILSAKQPKLPLPTIDQGCGVVLGIAGVTSFLWAIVR